MGHYEIKADSIIARGAIGDSITFTIHDTTGFNDISIPDGGWRSINFTNFADFEFCRIMYGKSIGSDNQGPMWEWGLLKHSGDGKDPYFYNDV
jgi:hypothetical protein